MWQLGDIVIYGSNGICKIDDIRDEVFSGEIKKYYILKPLFDEKNTFFVPSFNTLLMSKLRPVLTRDEALELIHKIPKIAPNWIDNDKVRIEQYKEILECGDREKVIAILKGIYERRAFLVERAKKLRNSDEIIMRQAEHLIGNECSHVLNIPRNELKDFIEKENNAI